MKIFNSIKWRLQLWYGLILVLVLAGFGMTAYQLESSRVSYQINAELNWRFDVLAKALHPHPPQRAAPPFDHSESKPMPEYNPTPAENPGPRKFEPPPLDVQQLFGTNQSNNFYFIVKNRNGMEIQRSANVPSAIMNVIDTIKSRPPAPRMRLDSVSIGNYQTIKNVLPSGEEIWVGCSIKPQLRELHRIAWIFFGVGIVILIFGLTIGGWFVSRAIRPINSISDAAAKISAGDLSQRINVADTEGELGKLAAVLNSTFARLEAAFAQQKQFASDAAHELRTPVSVILTQTQTTLNREREAKDYKETVEACQRAAQRMKKLISALLELARLDAGQEQLKRLSFDFSRTIGDCVELIRPLANQRNVKIISELQPLQITGDAERLGQVIVNLLTNAIQYNCDGGEVRVNLKPENGMAVLTVSDTGYGIPPEDLPRVFDRFHRADKSRTGANAGLGLAICEAIVAAHSGTIEVASQEDIGTTFTVRLPV